MAMPVLEGNEEWVLVTAVTVVSAIISVWSVERHRGLRPVVRRTRPLPQVGVPESRAS